MSIPSSGQVSMGDIRTELSNTGTSDFSLQKAGRPTTGVPGTFQNPVYTPINQSSTTKPNDAAPYAISEWRSYNHSENLPCSGTSFTTPSLGKFYTYYRVNITGTIQHVSNITVSGNSINNHWCYIYLTYPFNNVGQITASPWTYSYFSNNNTKTFRRGLAATSEVLYFIFYEDGN